LRDKVEEIIDTFNLLSPENKGTLFECARNTLKAANSTKKTTVCAKCGGEMLDVCPLCKNIAS